MLQLNKLCFNWFWATDTFSDALKYSSNRSQPTKDNSRNTWSSCPHRKGLSPNWRQDPPKKYVTTLKIYSAIILDFLWDKLISYDLIIFLDKVNLPRILILLSVLTSNYSRSDNLLLPAPAAWKRTLIKSKRSFVLSTIEDHRPTWSLWKSLVLMSGEAAMEAWTNISFEFKMNRNSFVSNFLSMLL